MSFAEWFLIMSPSIKQIIFVKCGLIGVCLFFMGVFFDEPFMSEKTRAVFKKVATALLIYVFVVTGLASLMPGSQESKQIRAELEKSTK